MKLIIAFLFTVTTISFSHAGFLIDPFLNYSFSDEAEQDIKTTGATTVTSKYDIGGSPELGLRLGYSLLGFQAGLSHGFSISDSDTEYTQSNQTFRYKYETSSSNTGLFLGYEFPILLRVYGTYFFSSKLEFTKDMDNDSEDDKDDEFTGKGFGLGAQYTGLPFLAIGLEFKSLKYDEFFNKSNSQTYNYPRTSGSTTTEELKRNQILLTLSVPFDI